MEGAGKTSVILSLLPKLPKDYKVVLLKVLSSISRQIFLLNTSQNEFGDVAVDSQLAKQSSLAAVSEILNGCMSVSVNVHLFKLWSNGMIKLGAAFWLVK
jgi:hypothetical protein